MKVNFFTILLICFYLIGNTRLHATDPELYTFLKEYYNSSEKLKENYSKLLYALKKGYRDLAIKLIESGENPDYFPSGNSKIPSPLMCVIFNEDEELVSNLIKKGADVNLNAYSSFGNAYFGPPLLNAVRNNKSEKITQMLCNSGANPLGDDVFKRWSETPLGLAYYNADLMKFLIIAANVLPDNLKKIDVAGHSLLTSERKHPSSIAEKENAVKIASYLIERGLRLENNHRSALCSAIRSGNGDLVEFFLSIGANVDHVPKKKDMKHCIEDNPLFAAIQYHKNRVQIIIPQPELNAYISSGIDLLCLILNEGANINFCLERSTKAQGNRILNEGYSPLSYAIHHQINDVASLLIACSADVDFIDNSCKTPLIVAVEVNNLDGVELLLSAGANPAKNGLNGVNPIDVAYSKGYIDILNILISAEAEFIEKKWAEVRD